MESAKKAQMKKIYVQLHRILCYILCSVNLTYLTAKYLAFDTHVDFGFYTPVTLTQPNLSLCFDLNTILGGHEVLMFNNHTPQFLGKTSKEIFDGTPSVDTIVHRCAYRDPGSDKIIQVENSTECYQLFTIKRYRMHCFICYLFHLNQRHNLSFNALAFSPNEPKFLYNVAIKGPLATGHSVAPIVHLDELADVDRIYMKELFPSKRDNEMYHLEYDLYEVERLPPPFATRCGPEPQLRCSYNCYDQEYKKNGLVRTSTVVRDTPGVSTLRVVEYDSNEKQQQLLSRSNADCAKRCNSEACGHKLLVTQLFGPFMSTHRLSFNLGANRRPINLMKYSPKFSFTDYITQSLSLSGIWVGFSLVSILYRRKRFDIVTTYKAWLSLKAKSKLLKRTFRAKMKKVVEKTEKDKQRSKKMLKFMATAFKLITFLIFMGQAFNLCFTYGKYETIFAYRHIFNPGYGNRLPSTVIA